MNETENKKLIWNDPDNIPDNDYRIVKVVGNGNDTSTIWYNGGLSEAEVPNHEIEELLTCENCEHTHTKAQRTSNHTCHYCDKEGR